MWVDENSKLLAEKKKIIELTIESSTFKIAQLLFATNIQIYIKHQ